MEEDAKAQADIVALQQNEEQEKVRKEHVEWIVMVWSVAEVFLCLHMPLCIDKCHHRAARLASQVLTGLRQWQQ
jgi:hypothetical protein